MALQQRKVIGYKEKPSRKYTKITINKDLKTTVQAYE